MEKIPRSGADEFCQKLKPQEKPIYVRDSQVKGLVLRVMPTGSKSWIFCYTAPCPKEEVAGAAKRSWSLPIWT